VSLEDGVNNFSKYRLEKVKAVNRDDTYDDWDEDESDDYRDYDFKMYGLDELEKLNNEIEANEILSKPFWKNIKKFFVKGAMSKVGIVLLKIEKMLDSDTFENIKIVDIERSLLELKKFSNYLFSRLIYGLIASILPIVLYYLMADITKWSFIWHFMIGWTGYKTLSKLFKYYKQKKWLKSAKIYIESQEENHGTIGDDEIEENQLEDVLEFNRFISKKDNEHWSIAVYDKVENLFKRKK
jgi:Lhr-like helicase